MSPRDGLRAVDAGYIRFSSWEENDAFWCGVVAQGRILERVTDGTRGRHAVWAHLVAHPGLPEGEVHAIFSDCQHFRIYRCTPEAARAAILDPSVFNLV